MKVLFRVDAGPHIGLGHLQRSLSLAMALKNLGAQSLFLTNKSNSSQERVESLGFPITKLPHLKSWTPEDGKSTLDLAAKYESNIVVVDSHEVETDYLAQLRNAGLYLVVRDDLAQHQFPCQIVVNGNADACQLPYTSTADGSRFLLGPRYAVLRPEYQDTNPREISASVQNILVIMGGADPQNLTPKILNTLDNMPETFSVTAVVGPFSNNLAGIQTTADNSNKAIELVHHPESVRRLMQEADLAISAAGQTLYELACTGCPTLAIKVASNQEGQMIAMENAGFVQVVRGKATDDVMSNLKIKLTPLLSDADTRRAMAAAGQLMVDGQGAQRVAEAILQRLTP